MLHVFSMWEAAPIDAGRHFSEVVHRSRRGRRWTTVLSAEFAFQTDLMGRLVRYKVAMTLDDLFLGFGVHSVCKDDDELRCIGVQKCMLNIKEKSEMWERILRSGKLITAFSTTFCRMCDGNKHRVL